MRSLSLVFVAAAVVSAQSALAADLPRAVPARAPAMVVPTATWTGFYAGLNAGYGWGSEAIGISGDPSLLTVAIPNGIVPASIADNPKGFIGGGQIGYNHQFGQWVLGVEADLQWSDIKRSQTVLTAAPGGLPPSGLARCVDASASYPRRSGSSTAPPVSPTAASA